MKYYPFDTQFCEYRFGSWSLTKDKLTFRHVTPYEENPNYGDLVIDNTFHYNSTQWEIRSGMGELREKEYPCCPRVDKFASFEKLVFPITLYNTKNSNGAYRFDL